MTKPNPQCYKMSASSIAAFKACPMRFRLSYREGLRVDGDTEALRVGTNWHAIHEVYHNSYGLHLGNHWKDHFNKARNVELWDYAQDKAHEGALADVVEHLAERYEKVPSWSDPISWDLERQKLLTCFIGYLWFYSDDQFDYLAQEISFKLPITVPGVGMNLPLTEAQRVGKIDHLINRDGMIGVLERKSTSRDIDPSSDYWDKSRKDTQVSMYALAIKDLHDAGELPLEGVEYDRVGNTLYDVWRRPQTKPKKLTQKDTTTFCEDGKYFGQEFEVERISQNEGEYFVIVDGENAEVEVGKKAIAIRETVSMYAARLMADITERPAYFFQRKEIVRTKKELDKFRIEVYSLYNAQKMYERAGCWYENENQCRATFACQYIPVCYGAGAEAVCDGKTTPPGFKRIFVDLSIEGQNSEGD